MKVTHSTVVVVPDDPDYPVGTNEWNADHTLADPYLSNGAVVEPTYTDNGNGTFTVGSGDYTLSDNVAGVGLPNKYVIAGGLFSPGDSVTSYLVADYNGGAPVLSLVTNVNVITETNVIPVRTLFRQGNELTTLSWDKLGVALSNKIHQSIVKTERFRRQSGLSLDEAATRTVLIEAGVIWYGATSQTLSAFNSSTDTFTLYAHVAGVWTEFPATQYNNTQYDNGTDLVALLPPRYAVNFVYRTVDAGVSRAHIILGRGDYNLTDAQKAVPPASLPAEISATCVLVGRIIVLKSAATATQIDTAFATPFSATPGSGATLFDAEIDFGTKPVYAKSFTIVDTSVSVASKVRVSPSSSTATGRVGNDDMEWDGLLMSASGNAGSINLNVVAVPGPVVGKRKIYYSVG